MIKFQYNEDRQFFADLLTDGDTRLLDTKFPNLFDFRNSLIKRIEFRVRRNSILRELIRKYGESCQLKIHPDCSKEQIWQPDHIIPLASNQLNKELRHMKRFSIKKVVQQSFGSNHPANLTLACKRCNAFKKNRILDANSTRRLLRTSASTE